MARGRSSGRGKKIDTFTVTTEAGAYVCDLRMEKTDSGTYFSARCNELGLEVGGRFAKPTLDADECEAELTKAVRATIEVDWKPHYLLTFKGRVGSFETELPRAQSGALPTAQLEITVTRVDLAETPLGKKHRYALRKYASDDADVRDDWPEVGVADPDGFHRYDRPKDPRELPLRSLVPVTPETTAAITNLLGGVDRLGDAFRTFMAPEAVGTFLSQLTTPGLPALPAAHDEDET